MFYWKELNFTELFYEGIWFYDLTKYLQKPQTQSFSAHTVY